MRLDEFDDADLMEYIQFKNAPFQVATMYNEKVKIVVCRIVPDSFEPYISQWNKNAIRCTVYELNYPFRDDIESFETEGPLFLTCGKRLLATLKRHKFESKYVCIHRIGEGFDTEYYVEDFKPTIQTKLTVSPKSKSKK